jgi:FkbM family methyltransferase
MKMRRWYKKRIKKRLFKIIVPSYATNLLRRKQFTVSYKGTKVLLSSVIQDDDILYHHFHAHSRSRLNFSSNAYERISVDLARDASLYIDIGGYNGIFGLLVAAGNPEAQVHIFEPNPLSSYVIYRNIVLNNLKNVTLHNAAVGKEESYTPFSINKNGSRVETAPSENHIRTRCTSLDILVEELEPKNWRKAVVKMDAEGMEKYCLEGMSRFTTRCRELDVLLTIHSPIISPVHGYKEEDVYQTAGAIGLKLISKEFFLDEVEVHLRKA